MGREIRKVTPNWEHPKKKGGGYQPMFDYSATEQFIEWLEGFGAFKNNELPEVADEHGYDINDPYTAYCDWDGGPPDPNYCRPYWDKSDATWWQVYETVSEGTPVSPPLSTQAELIDYLVENGDFWDQKKRNDLRPHPVSSGPWPRKAAEKFVNGVGWAPSLIIDGEGMKRGVEGLAVEGVDNTHRPKSEHGTK